MKKEIFKLRDTVVLNGNTLIPLKIYFVKGKVKVLLGVCKGKKTYDKKETLKVRDLDREMMKNTKFR